MESPELKSNDNNQDFYELNNLLNIPDKDNRIRVDKDKEAVRRYFLDHVNPNTVYFHDLEEKVDYLIENDFIEENFINKYDFEFIKDLFKFVYGKKFRFRTFMGAYKYYTRYSMKTDDGQRYLERYEDRISFTALYLADGDEELAMDMAEEMIERRYQPATPTFLSAGKKRRGEMVSCFLLSATDDMDSIGRLINSSLQLSKLGGGVGRERCPL